MKLNRIFFGLALAGIFLTWLPARADEPVDGVTLKGEQVFALRGDKRELLTEDLKLSAEIEVSTNGTFIVAKGKDRSLRPGQVLRSDGWLMETDGSAAPVFDHLAMKSGKVFVVRDGQAAPLTQLMKFPNNLRINPDGSCTYPSGAVTRLADGQMFRLDGTAILVKDTISLRNGRVIVQKDGMMISLQPVQLMGMSDGTRVRGDGFIQQRDGKSFQLREGQTIFVEGALVKH
jgi:hypothetical protein